MENASLITSPTFSPPQALKMVGSFSLGGARKKRSPVRCKTVKSCGRSRSPWKAQPRPAALSLRLAVPRIGRHNNQRRHVVTVSITTPPSPPPPSHLPLPPLPSPSPRSRHRQRRHCRPCHRCLAATIETGTVAAVAKPAAAVPTALTSPAVGVALAALAITALATAGLATAGLAATSPATRHHHLTRRRHHHSPPEPLPPPYRRRPRHHFRSLATGALATAAIAIAAHTAATLAAAASPPPPPLALTKHPSGAPKPLWDRGWSRGAFSHENGLEECKILNCFPLRGRVTYRPLVNTPPPWPESRVSSVGRSTGSSSPIEKKRHL